ncbi:MAG: phosphatase PAP2 family protein [Gemmatimonadetes bacterium]|nr:phosphatase PAP2 family protein [Gemmatimonadota bacterium]
MGLAQPLRETALSAVRGARPSDHASLPRAWSPGSAAPTSPFPALAEWAGGLGGLGLVANALVLDPGATQLVRRVSGDDGREASRVFHGVDNLWHLWPVAVGATAIGTLFDRSAPRTAVEIVAGVSTASLVSEVLKRSLGRERPRDTADPFRFQPFSGHAAFPSGHATVAFALAGAVAAETGNRWLRAGAWGLAIGVGWSRINAGAHWYSDVVAGAVVGRLVGYHVTRWARTRLRGDAGAGSGSGAAARGGLPSPVVVLLPDGLGIGVRLWGDEGDEGDESLTSSFSEAGRSPP